MYEYLIIAFSKKSTILALSEVTWWIW